MELSAEELIITSTLTAIMIAAAAFDLRRYRIPNALTASGVLIMLGLNYLSGSFDGLTASLLGLACAFAAHFLLFAWGILGAGDVKLFCVVGAALGAGAMLTVWLFVALAGGVQAGWIIARAALARRRAGADEALLAGRKACYGVAIAAGTLGTLGWRALGHDYIRVF
ncbi:A24 family peptidase [Fundidesulfovibrio terrae]|uniref:A24 family peptidase n=1 Tax=Fundidesulfovibrio terrae TaxID=2922866 RepID=UPI001FAEED46